MNFFIFASYYLYSGMSKKAYIVDVSPDIHWYLIDGNTTQESRASSYKKPYFSSL